MIVVVGLSHHTAPIEVRERAALSEERTADLVRQLLDSQEVTEAFVISTCNRMEVVLATGSAGNPARPLNAEPQRVLDEVTDTLESHVPTIRSHLYRHAGAEAVRHLFRVAASLDSMVRGEPQILGQVKGAVEIARDHGTLGSELERLVSAAFHAAKRVRTETTLGAGQVSIPSIAVDLAKQIFGELAGRHVVLVGSGDMGETVAKLLAQVGALLTILGRNEQRVSDLVERLGGDGRIFSEEELEAALLHADVIIGTTSAPVCIVHENTVARAMKKRKGRSLFFIDLAVPRDIEPGVGDLENVFLYNVDDFAQVVERTVSSREQEADRAEEIVDEETKSFERRLTVGQVAPAIGALRQRIQLHLEGELERSLKGKLKHLGDSERAALGKMLDAALKKLLHPPSSKLRDMALSGDQEALDAALNLLVDLFELEQGLTDAGRVQSLDGAAPPADLPRKAGTKY